jgi:2-methylcitrate synthase/citrate synthase II
MTQPDIKRGLDGVIADESKISKVIADKQYLTYRGYPVPALAEQCRFEEVVYLLWHSELPNQSQLDEFSATERSLRPIDAATVNFIHQFPRDTHPMRMMQAAVTYLGMRDGDAEAMDEAANRRKAMKLLAQLPTVMAACLRHSQGKEYIPPCPDRSYAANFFYMCFDRQVPKGDVVKAFDASLTLYAEHGFNASTFAARVIGSSLADMHSAIAGAIGSLKGPLHGGANEAVMHLLLDVGKPENAQAWLENAFATKRKIMGFGHRLYKLGDSRVPTMKKFRDQTAAVLGGQEWIEISNVLENAMIVQKNIYPNLDFPAGPTYYLMGFPIPFFTPIFVCARLSGWAAHLFEQYGNNRLIRPSSYYTGVGERAVVPLGAR